MRSPPFAEYPHGNAVAIHGMVVITRDTLLLPPVTLDALRSLPQLQRTRQLRPALPFLKRLRFLEQPQRTCRRLPEVF